MPSSFLLAIQILPVIAVTRLLLHSRLIMLVEVTREDVA